MITLGLYVPTNQPPTHTITCANSKALKAALRKVLQCDHICIDSPDPVSRSGQAGVHAVVQGWDYSDPKVEDGAYVFALRDGMVFYVADHGAGYDAHSSTPDMFAKRYGVRLLKYPARRYARRCMDTKAPRSANAAKVLRHLLAQ